MRSTGAVATVLALASVAGAQPQPQRRPETQGTVTYTLDYHVYRAAGPGGTWTQAQFIGGAGTPVGPGEGALLRVKMLISGYPWYFDPVAQVFASPQTWDRWLPSIPPGSSGSGVLAGFWNGDVDVVGDGGAPSALGTWSDGSAAFDAAVRRRLMVFTAGGGIGYVNGSQSGTGPASRVTDIQPAQFGPDAGQLINTTQAHVWTGLWVPTEYTPRSVEFAATIGSLGFLSQIAAMDDWYWAGFPHPVPLKRQTLFGPGVSIQVVPAPAAMAAAWLAGLLAARRRR